MKQTEWPEKTDTEIMALAAEMQKELAEPLVRGDSDLELLALCTGLWRARCAGFKEASDMVDATLGMMMELGPGSDGEPPVQECQHEWINVTQFMSDPVIRERCGICNIERTRQPGVEVDS